MANDTKLKKSSFSPFPFMQHRIENRLKTSIEGQAMVNFNYPTCASE